MNNNKHMAKFTVSRGPRNNPSKAPEQIEDIYHLHITTNVIDDDVLDLILNSNYQDKYIIFQCSYTPQNKDFNFKVTSSKWQQFADNLKGVHFYGRFVNNQFQLEHLKACMDLNHLTISATDYPLFQNDELKDLYNLPLTRLTLNGYGMVQFNANFQDFLDHLIGNKCNVVQLV